MPAVLAPGPRPVDTNLLHCFSSPWPATQSRGGRWWAAGPWWTGSWGNGPDRGLRGGASPEGACQVEYRGAAIGHPEGATGRLGGCQRIRPSCWACAAASVRLAAPIMSPYRSRWIQWDASACCETGEEGRHSYRLDASLWPLGIEGQRDGKHCGGDDGPQHQHGLLPAQALVQAARLREGCAPARPPLGMARTVGCRRPAPHPIFSPAGTSSPAASRLKMFSMEASLGSEQASPSSMQPRA